LGEERFSGLVEVAQASACGGAVEQKIKSHRLSFAILRIKSLCY
jgi:hypothetical protein